MKELLHNAHIALTLYMAFGWLFPHPEMYTVSALVVLSGWHIFGECVLNRNMEYPDNSFIKGVAARMGFNDKVQEDALSNFMFLFFFGLSVGTYRAAFPRYMTSIIYFYIITSLWVFQSGDIKKIIKRQSLLNIK